MRRADGKIARGSLQIRSMNTAWLEMCGAVPVKVLVISKAETVSVMTDFLVFISEFIGLCC
jgi:alpha-D-ribose 1-methylphosphonate 5-triphosphate synthase subunit PhnL